MKRFTSFCISAAMVIAAWPGVTLPARAAQAEDSGYAVEIEADAPLPVGGWSDHEEILVEDYEAPETDGEVYESRRVLNASVDNFFSKSVGTYGRNSLSTEQKAFYDKIDEAATEFMESGSNLSPTTVNLVGGTSADYYVVKKITKDSGSSLTVDQMVQALYAFDYDHPAYYWLSNGYLSGSDNISLLTYEEYSQFSDRATINRAIVNGAKEIIDKAELGEDTLDKIAIVHDQIIDKIDYAYEADGVTPVSDKWAHSVQGVFDGHNAAVCEGYTDTFAMIMNYMDIENCYVVGTATNGGNGGGGGHAWNLVSEDGSKYYYMDVTWDDNGNGARSYTYFGMPKTDFEASHTAYTPEGVRSKWLYSLPADISDSFDGLYYSRAGYYYDYDGGADATAFAKRLVTRSKRFGSGVAFMGKSVFDKVVPVYKAYGLTTVTHSTVTCKGESYWLCTMNVGDVDISGATVTLPQTSYDYTGSDITPEPEVTCNGVKLIEDLNYTVSYADNTEAGNATVTVTGCGNFTGSSSAEFTIVGEEPVIVVPKSIEDCEVTGLGARAWTGSAISPEVTVKDGDAVLTKDTDYTVSYSNNTNVGKASVIITGKGAYGGTLGKSFIIKKVKLKYRAYVQKKNWMSWSEALVSGTTASTMAGTTDNLRMETIQMQLSGVTGAVKYRAYVEKMGWTQWATTADTTTFAGTKGMSRRVEMIQLQASGQAATLYDMYYRAYSEKFGWLGWAKSGEKAGSAGYARKLEAFQVNFVRKGEDFLLTSPRAKCYYDKSKDGENPK